jgi:hypothetical protein
MISCLSAFFNSSVSSPLSYPDRESQRMLLSKRSVLPAPTHFLFKGANEDSEDHLARVSMPARLCQLWVTFFNDIDFGTPQLAHFISRT